MPRLPAQDICFPCGARHGQRPEEPYIGTYHTGRCAWCGAENVSVTSATDFKLWAPETAK